MISDIDKMQALFVPSLEYRIYFLLKKLIYSADFQLTKQFSYLKRFIDAIVAWTDPLNGVAEYDIDITKGIRRNTVKHVMKNDLITCFLDSIILYHRLNKICHELNFLGIENNILRSLNSWTNNFTISITATNCNMNLEATTFCHAKKPVICKKSTELLTTNDIYHDKIIKHVRLIMPKYQMQEQQNQQILYSDQNFLQKEQNNMSYCTHNINKQKKEQNDDINNFFNDKSYNIKLKKIQTAPTLKIIVRKIYLENVYFSRPLIIRLLLPCKTNDLIQCIFEVDPFLSESCLIVMKRKFQDCMHNVCSCLNDSFGKLNAKVAKTLRLDCNIRPGYISFKLKVGGKSNTDRYLFVARVPICQNVCKHMIQQDSITYSSKLNIKTNISQYFNLCENDNNKFNNTFNDVYMDEQNNKLNNICYSYLDQSFIKNIMPNTLKYKRKNKKETICTIIEKIPKYFNDLTICSCDKACENITNEILNIADLEKNNENFCKILDSVEIDYNDHMKKYKENPHLSNSIIKNDESIQLANNANYLCLSYNISIKTNKNIITIYTKNLINSSQISDINEYEQICLSNKESNAGNKYHDINTHSITSFVQNSDRDKQLVELNCNCFLQNTKMINKRSHKNNSSLNSTKVDIECDSSCSQHDFINITVIDNISKENIIYVFDIFQNNLDAIEYRNTNYFDTIKTLSKNNLLTASLQMPRLIRSSKYINVDITSRTVWLTSDYDTDISIIMKKCDNHKKVTNSSTQSLIVLKRKNIHDIYIEHNAYNGTQNSIKLSDRLFMSKKELRSNRKSRSSDISVDKCFYTKNFSTYMTSKTSCSCPLITVTNGFTTNENREKFEKSCKLKKSYVYRHFDINSIISTIKYKTTFRQDDYFADIRLRTTYMMTKFRDSINKSINRIKRLIRAKLARVLLNKKTGTIIILKNKFSKNKAFFRNMKKKTIGKCIRQNYDVTSCSTCDYYKQSCILFSQSPNVLSIQSKNWGRTNSEEGIKVYHRKLSNSSKILSSFHSIIQITPQSYDLLTSTTENLKEWKSISNNQQPYYKEKNIKNKQNITNYNGNSYQYNFKNYKTNIIISSSDKISFIENYPKYFEYYIRKRKRKTCSNKNIMNRFIISENIKHNTYAQATEDYLKKGYQRSPLYVHEGKSENVYEQIYRMFRLKNLKKFSSLKNNRQIVGKKINISDYFDNHCLRKKFAFMVLIQKDNNYISNIDLDFKLKLLRYVELCKNVKRALIKTL